MTAVAATAASPPPKRDGAPVRLAVALCVVGHLGLSLIWAVLMPPFEAHDETGHFAHAQYVATYLRIPPPGGVITPWFDEAHQPPLYYWVVGLSGYALGLGGDMQPDINPFFLRGDRQGGANAVVHDPPQEVWTDHAWSRLLLLARVWSCLFGAVAVWITYLVARSVAPDRPWIGVLAAGFAAGIPTFVFISAAANNDAAVGAMGGLALLGYLRWVTAGPSSRSLVPPVLCGVAIGLALLTKNSALPLVAAVVAVPLVRMWEHKIRDRRLIVEALLAAVSCALVAGWWYARNIVLYHHLVMDRTEHDSVVLQPLPASSTLVQAASSHFVTALAQYSFTSFWALFGWGNIGADASTYMIFLAISGVAALGWLIVGVSRAARSSLGLCHVPFAMSTLLLALLVALPIYRAVRYASTTLVPGRYTFVGLTVICLLLALGAWVVTAWLPNVVALLARTLLVFTPSLIALLSLFRTVLPAYAAPVLLTDSVIRAEATPYYVAYGDSVALVGYTIPVSSVSPGDDLVVTLYWKALARMDVSYTVSLQLLDDKRNVVGRTDRLPGLGNFPTTRWQPGDEFRETYRVQLAPTTSRDPQLGHVLVAVSQYAPSKPGGDDFATRAVLQPTDAQHQQTDPLLTDIRLGAQPVAEPRLPVRYTFANTFALTKLTFPMGQASSGEAMPVSLEFQALASSAHRAKVFVHLLSGGKVVAQEDAEPVVDGGLYPTSIWSPGEIVRVTLAPHWPNGAALAMPSVEIGMYWVDTQQRLPIVDSQGASQADNRILLKLPS
jgi:hypothetical protein